MFLRGIVGTLTLNRKSILKLNMMQSSQTNSSKLGAAVLFVCTFATWRQNLQIFGGMIYLIRLWFSISMESTVVIGHAAHQTGVTQPQPSSVLYVDRNIDTKE